MSTATIAAGNVRPFSAIKADMANVLANKPQSVYADAKAALTWLPRKAYNAALRALRWLHVPQFYTFVRANLAKFLSVVGKGAFTVEMLTSHWGQKTIVKTIEVGAKVLNTAVKVAWRVLTSPLRLFGPTKSVVTRVENSVAKANRKLTPDSGETFGALQITRDIAGHALSADRTHMKLARTTAVAVMAVRVTRRFAPAGWMRVAAYVLDGLMIARSFEEILEKTWVGRKLSSRAAVIEADVLRQAETVGAEATRITREAAADTAAKMRTEANLIETEAAELARQTQGQIIVEAEDKADQMRREATALEESAERLAAAEAAHEAVAQEQAVATAVATETPAEPAEVVLVDAEQATAVAVAEKPKPKPGPAVPQMGGRAPGSGPQQQPHQRHGGHKPPKKN